MVLFTRQRMSWWVIFYPVLPLVSVVDREATNHQCKSDFFEKNTAAGWMCEMHARREKDKDKFSLLS
jgi:hypothetical protein